jgi:ATP-dependent exoDNAse (exonuclease V) beta subunit
MVLATKQWRPVAGSCAHQEGHAWGDMAIICRHYSEMDECAGVLRQRGLPPRCAKAQLRPGR